jgi:hypothetical protein
VFAVKARKADLIIPAVVLVAAAALFLMFFSAGKDKPQYLYVYRQGGGEPARYPLYEDREIEFSGGGYTLNAVISGGGVEIASSDCPGNDCVRTGRITKKGQTIVCIPAGLIFSRGGGEGEAAAGAG